MVSYRRDIDGLRALAVMAVVLFHAKVPGLSGGFTGVDIFFVISGYLITGNIMREVSENRFSFSTFYERRIRRILPALFVMFGLVTIAACVMLLPDALRNYGSSMTSAALFTANFYFAGKTGYFDGSAVDKPLLHVWSLALEEQFYIVFPIIFMAGLWLGRKVSSRPHVLLAACLAGLALVSMVFAQLALNEIGGTPATAFYLLPYRAWEFITGALLAMATLPELRHGLLRNGVAMAGLGLIIGGIAGLSEASPFPGIAALLPCLGAGMIIYAGRSGNTLVSGLLSWKPVVFIGLISYSLYLWHWPMLVIPQIWHVTPLTPEVRALLVLIAMVIAVLSWAFVETPVRQRRLLTSKKSVFAAAATALLLIVGAGVFLKATKGLPQRLPENVLQVDAARKSQNPRLHECFKMNDKLDTRNITPATACTYGSKDVTPTWALWGDSHADGFITPLGDMAAHYNTGVKFFGMSGCPPLPDFEFGGEEHRKRCAAFTRETFQIIQNDKDLKTIILMARLGGYVLDEDDKEAQQQKLAMFRSSLQSLVDALLKNNKRVVIVYPVPETGVDTPAMLAQLMIRGVKPESFTTSIPAYNLRNQPVLDVLENLQGNIRKVKPIDWLCEGTTCATMRHSAPLYYDNHHLSQAGGRELAQGFENYFVKP